MSRKITCPESGGSERSGQGVVLPLQGTNEANCQKVPGANGKNSKQVLPLGEAGPKGLKGQGIHPAAKGRLMVSLP